MDKASGVARCPCPGFGFVSQRAFLRFPPISSTKLVMNTINSTSLCKLRAFRILLATQLRISSRDISTTPPPLLSLQFLLVFFPRPFATSVTPAKTSYAMSVPEIVMEGIHGDVEVNEVIENENAKVEQNSFRFIIRSYCRGAVGNEGLLSKSKLWNKGFLPKPKRALFFL